MPGKRHLRPAGLDKMNSLGLPIAEVNGRLRSKEEHVQMIKNLIAERVASAESKHELDKEVIYIISLAYFGRTYKGSYLPAELGVVKYTLQSGVMDRMHMYINPGEMPLGAPLVVQTHTGQTHKLPIPPNAWGIADMNEVAVRLLSFLGAEEEIPPLFTDEETLQSVESMLREILSKHIEYKMLYVCPLSELFCKLKQATERHAMNRSTFPSALMAQHLLKIDCYWFAVGISCEYHEKELNSLNCALSQATRWAYMISKYCCLHLGIECVPGKHIPLNLFPTEAKLEPSASGINVLVQQEPADSSRATITSGFQQPNANSLYLSETSAPSDKPSCTGSWDTDSQNQDDEFPSLEQSVEPAVSRRGHGRGQRRGTKFRGRGHSSRGR